MDFHSDIGFYELTARLYQMEATRIVEVVAGSPHEFIFDDNIVVRSGSPMQIDPVLVDINGYSMDSNLAGPNCGLLRMAA